LCSRAGKTSLAQIVAHRLARARRERGGAPGGFYQLLPDQVPNKATMNVFMEELVRDPYAFVFIDEVHLLVRNVGGEPLFHTLQDTGTPRYPLQGGGWLDVPRTISWVAATTDQGEMDNTTGAALMRRLEPVIRLDAPKVEDVAQIIMDQDFPTHPDAARDAARRCGGLPWMAVHLHKEMRNVAIYRGEDEITPTVAMQTFENLEIDERGVTKEDRLIIKALLRNPRTLRDKERTVIYAMSEQALCASAGIDRELFKKMVQPRLFRLGLLTLGSGQRLTDQATVLFGHLAE
jgi:Holliday junction resolvasome RuvABC ATP-dependent DNA helicase subunit